MAEERTQDFPLTEVPEEAQLPNWSIGLILCGFSLFVGAFYAGGQVGTGFTFWTLIGVVMAGSLLLALYVGLLGVVAQRSGLNTVLLARFSFGNHGSKLVDCLLGFTQIGWFAWQISLPAVILSAYIGESWRIPMLILLAASFTWTAYIGISALAILSRIAVPAILLLMALSVGVTLNDVGEVGSLVQAEPTSSIGIAAAITVIFGSFASGGANTSNWTRFCSSPQGAFFASFVAFISGCSLMLLAGALGALVYGEPDMTTVLAEQGLLVPGLLLTLISMWILTDRTVYAFSVAGANLFRTENRRFLAIAGACIGTLLAIGGFYDFFVDYLTLLGTYIPPIVGVIAADYFVKHRGRLPYINSAQLPAINWAGILSYIASSAIAQFSPGVPPINGLLAAFVLYLIFDRASRL